jgi:hypothetical protein
MKELKKTDYPRRHRLAKPSNLAKNRTINDPPESGENQEKSSTPNPTSHDLLFGGKNTACFGWIKENPTKRD